jgi:hypothetical protein
LIEVWRKICLHPLKNLEYYQLELVFGGKHKLNFDVCQRFFPTCSENTAFGRLVDFRFHKTKHIFYHLRKCNKRSLWLLSFCRLVSSKVSSYKKSHRQPQLWVKLVYIIHVDWEGFGTVHTSPSKG